MTSFSDATWLDAAGNYHSDALHVVERYTRADRDTLIYEASIEDRRYSLGLGRSACRSAFKPDLAPKF